MIWLLFSQGWEIYSLWELRLRKENLDTDKERGSWRARGAVCDLRVEKKVKSGPRS